MVQDTILPLLSPKSVPHKVHIMNKHTDTETIAKAIAEKAAELGAHSITLAHHQKGALTVCPHRVPKTHMQHLLAACAQPTAAHRQDHQHQLHIAVARTSNLPGMHDCSLQLNRTCNGSAFELAARLQPLPGCNTDDSLWRCFCTAVLPSNVVNQGHSPGSRCPLVGSNRLGSMCLRSPHSKRKGDTCCSNGSSDRCAQS